jgi:hypothetical protein
MKIAVWLNNGSPGEAATFYGACARVRQHEPKTLIRGLHSGEALVALARPTGVRRGFWTTISASRPAGRGTSGRCPCPDSYARGRQR